MSRTAHSRYNCPVEILDPKRAQLFESVRWAEFPSISGRELPEQFFIWSNPGLQLRFGWAMHVKLLIDDIVRQTTILIAQLSTAAGVRAPLSSLADQVFIELARELEGQGVRRTVVADMFGLALRSYQIKFQRLSEVAPAQPSTWQELHALLNQRAHSRAELVRALRPADPADITAVLNDLVGSGLAYVSGRGANAVYGLTPETDRLHQTQLEEHHALTHLIWQLVATGRCTTRAQLGKQLHVDPSAMAEALEALLLDGRVVAEGEELRAKTLDIPVGAEQGWEAAVSDHFRAVATAIAAKLRHGRSEKGDRVGGATLSFTVHSDHPHESRVYGLLERTRGELEALWAEVSEWNAKHPPPQDAPKVTFYFGQHVTSDEQSDVPGETQ